MKKLIPLFFIVLLALTLQAVPAHAQEAVPPQLAYYDAQIDVLLPRLEYFQFEYHLVAGSYYQALQSHSTAPDVPTAPDGLSSAPTDQDANLAFFWDNFAALPPELSWAFRIDTYSGPSGDGYVLTVTTVIAGEAWERAINYGPDNWRGHDWVHVLPGE